MIGLEGADEARRTRIAEGIGDRFDRYAVLQKRSSTLHLQTQDKECLDRDGEGLHHIAFHTRSIDSDIAEAAQNGFACVQRGDWLDTPQNGTYAYLDTKDALKCTVELLDFVKRQTK